MIRMLAVTIAATIIAAPDPTSAQSKSNERPVSASRFGISVDGVQKPKAKGLKSSKSKKGSAAKGYKLENAWPKKNY